MHAEYTCSHVSAACAGKQILLQRGQRQRKKPHWLDNTIDPHLPDKKWGLPNSRQVLLAHNLHLQGMHLIHVASKNGTSPLAGGALRVITVSQHARGFVCTVQDLEYEGSMPLESDTGSGAAAGAPKRRKRSQHPQSHFQYQ